MQGSSEARRSRESLSFYSRWQHGAQQSVFFLLHCNKHTKGIRSIKSTHTVRHTLTAGCESAVLGGHKKIVGFCAARAEDTHMRVLFLDSQHPEDTHRGVLRFKDSSSWGHTPSEGREEGVVLRQAPLRTHKGGQWWYLRGPCGRALPVSRSISCSCLRLIGPPVLLMHAATANPLWALASCRGLSTAEDVNNRAGDKKEKKTERYNDRVAEEERVRGEKRKESNKEGKRETKCEDGRTGETKRRKRKKKQSRRSGYEGAGMHYAPLL